MTNPDNIHYYPVPDILFAEDEHEMVLFDPNRGLVEGVYVLDEIGARIWQFIVEDGHKSSIVERLLLEYDVDKDTLDTALDEFCVQLIEHGFLYKRLAEDKL